MLNYNTVKSILPILQVFCRSCDVCLSSAEGLNKHFDGDGVGAAAKQIRIAVSTRIPSNALCSIILMHIWVMNTRIQIS